MGFFLGGGEDGRVNADTINCLRNDAHVLLNVPDK
jgi:hypothetical protein